METKKITDILSGIAVKPAKLPVHIYVLTLLSAFFHDLGKSVCEIVMDLVNGVLLFTGRFVGFVWVKTAKFRGFMLGKLKYFGIFAASPFIKLGSSFIEMRRETKAANREYGMKGAIPVFFGHLIAFIFGKRSGGAVTTVFNYAAPIISLLFLYNVISYASGIEYAVRLEIDGTFVGYIENERVYTEAERIFEQRINYLGSTLAVEFVPRFTVEKAGDSAILNASEVTNILLRRSGISVAYAYGIIINGNFMGSVRDNTEILATRENLLSAHRTGAVDEEVEFLWTFEAEQGDLFPAESIVDPQIIIRSITRNNEEAQFYTVAEGDSHYLISEILDVSMDELERLNPGFSEQELFPGDRIKFSAAVPHLPVAVTRTEIYDQHISFLTEYRDVDTLFVNTQHTSVVGQYGIDRITARVTLLNGVEIGRRIENREHVSDPVTQIISRGTRIPVGTVSNQEGEAGKFIWPLPTQHGISEWGWWDGGYSGHSGIDFGAPYGTPIFAGANGTVSFSGWFAGYGNTVIIDHDDGLRTLYGHASVLNVSVGDTVIQGETVAFVGATGRADGNHLHFEVRSSGGQILNPRGYLLFP
jgi:murein DD-endopeptidase MepM/ murein hydrolase activator NlpD